MKKHVSLKDIAQRVGVSTALVSYVLSGKEREARVGQEIAEVIRKTAAELNYQPNHLAKSLKTGKSHTIGLIVADISNPFFATIARCVEDEAKRDNYTAIFGSSDENPGKMRDLLDVLIKRQVDGFIIAPTQGSEAHVRYLKELRVPFVLIDRYFPGVDTNYVCADNHGAAYRATEHLIAKGHRAIGLVVYQDGLVHMLDRERGFRQALEDHGIEPRQSAVLHVGFDRVAEDLRTGLAGFFTGAQPVDALLFATNTLSLEGLKRLDGLGYRIPRDVAVVCFDESEPYDFFYCPITYVKQPTDAIAKRAVRILVDQIENGGLQTQQERYGTELVVRGSCGVSSDRGYSTTTPI